MYIQQPQPHIPKPTHIPNPTPTNPIRTHTTQQQPKISPISQIFKQKQSSMWKSVKDKIQVQEGAKVEEISYSFRGDNNFRAYKVPSQVYPALNNTFVVYFAGDHTRGSKIVHYSSDGAILKFLFIQKVKLDVHMMSEKHVLFFTQSHQGGQHRIEQWDLETYERISIPYLKVFNNNISVITFNQSNLFCVCEFQTHRFRNMRVELSLTYYQYPLQNKEDNFIAQLSRTFKKFDQNDDVNIVKLNQQSMIGFINDTFKSEQCSKFCSYSLRQGKILQKIHKFPNNFHPNSNICFSKITDLWEVEAGKFFINLRTEIDLRKIDYEEEAEKYNQQANKDIQRNYSFIWEYQNNCYRKTKFDITEDSQIQVLDSLRLQKRVVATRPNLDQRYMIRNFNIRPNLPRKILPIKYMDAINEQIIVKITPNSQQLAFTGEQPKKSHPTYLPNYEVLFYVSSRGLVNIWVRRIKCLKFRVEDLTVFFMNQLMAQEGDEEWDEDLLLYISQIAKGKDETQQIYQLLQQFPLLNQSQQLN